MKYKDGVTVIFLCSLLIISYKASRTCDYKSLVGESVIIKLSKPAQNTEEIKWTHTSVHGISKKIGHVKKRGQNKTGDLTENGSLMVKKVSLQSEGSYIVFIYDNDGKQQFKDTKELCIYERISKPNITVDCKEKEKPKLKCTFQPKKEEEITWLKDGKHVNSKETILEVKNHDYSKYKCSVRNPVHSNASEEVIADCSDPNEQLLWGFDLWIMVAILAGGGGLILLLIVVLIIFACRSCKRREKHHLDEEEFRLNHLHNPSFCDEPRSKHTARGQPAPPVPEDDADEYTNDTSMVLPQIQTKTKGQSRGRPPPPPIDEDEETPPLPQPRKKAPRTKNCEPPMYMQP
ncbi:uncharacterized protein cd2 [Brachyhypopomus gauderio]|uniref:uncharacterized protein cd2 n=1 Tax=Brachyhypopomus gauderio TaxID=698409 RepID=UPI004042783F